MHAHIHATPERTQAPAQMLRGVAGPCAPLGGEVAASSRKTWFSGWDKDFGSFVGGGPV